MYGLYITLDEAEKENLIYCTGIDNKIHRCVSWKDTALCGMNVFKKNINIPYQTYTCWECESIEYQETGDC